jgi:hypothetical protein
MTRFAAKQLDESGEPLYYLIEYEITNKAGTFIYSGRALATSDINKELTEEDEAFTFSFDRKGSDWTIINKIKVESKLGEEIAEKIKLTFFSDLVLSGIMGVEQRKN